MKYNKWTQEEIDFVQKCKRKGMTYREIADKLELIYDRKASPSNISRFVPKKKKERKEGKKEGKRWSKEEDTLLFQLKNQDLTYPEIAEKMGRTTKAVSIRLARIKKENIAVKQTIQLVSETEPKEKKWANNRCNYTPQQELGIMVDFPNLSIDEMREKYQRDYRALAARYEDIWDSAEEARISLLKEASLIIEARKREELEQAEKKATEPRMGWFERRKMRRVARKAAKIQKRLDRMATKYGAILTNGDD